MLKLNTFHLKTIALVVMLMDHLYFSFSDVFPAWFHPLSRFVAPLFVFLMVEGLFYTRNKLRYNLRLYGWAFFMMLGNYAVNIIFASKEISVHNNIFMTLALALTILNLFELSRKSSGNKKRGLFALAVILTPLGILVEGGLILIPFSIITYFFRDNRKKAFMGYIILSIISFSIFDYRSYETFEMTIKMLMFNSDFLFITVVPFILLYNGERGLNNKFSKYLFYIFYPLHLWGLAILEFILM